MEPLNKKIKLDIVNLNYKFQNLTLKRKNESEIDEINKKIKIESDKIKSDKIKSDKNEKKRKYDSNKDVIKKIKSCSLEYAEYNKKYNKENDNDPDEDSIKQSKRLPIDDLIYRYII